MKREVSDYLKHTIMKSEVYDHFKYAILYTIFKKSKKITEKKILAESLRSGLNLYDNCRWINDLDSYHTIIDRKNTILTYKNDHLRKVYNYLRNVCWFDNQIRSLIWKYTIQRDFLKSQYTIGSYSFNFRIVYFQCWS